VCAVSDAQNLCPALELYVILDESLVSSDRHELLESIIRGGADAIQYRAKELSKRQYYENVITLLPITRRSGVPLFVNDHLDIALAVSADGIHLGQNDLPCSAARSLIPRQMLLGVSSHSLEEASNAVNEDADYVAIGSVFPTTTKENPEAIVGTEMIAAVKEITGDTPLIAIGGIHARNVASVVRAGADGIAVASAVLRAEDPYRAVKELKERIQAAQRT
jgi:thiamine-phosphate pyrophosphorylase